MIEKDKRSPQQLRRLTEGLGNMKVTTLYIFLSAGMIAGSTVWSGCYTQLATSSDSAVSEAEFDTTAANQISAINEVAQSAFMNDPWVVAPFVPFYLPSHFARTPFQKKGVVSTYRPLPFAGTPSVSSSPAAQAPSPHRQSGYQRSSTPDQAGSRSPNSAPSRASQIPASPSIPRTGAPASSTPRTDAPAPSTPRTGTPAPSAPRTSTPTPSAPTTSAPPANNRAGGATRSGR
jgi:hypothetical protein